MPSGTWILLDTSDTFRYMILYNFNDEFPPNKEDDHDEFPPKH